MGQKWPKSDYIILAWSLIGLYIDTMPAVIPLDQIAYVKNWLAMVYLKGRVNLRIMDKKWLLQMLNS